jgi:hypothetical protein
LIPAIAISDNSSCLMAKGITPESKYPSDIRHFWAMNRNGLVVSLNRVE